ncbi:MAG: hypothetical protein IJ758_04465 [Clostridia bacterium]|nr:hypothetical protein [Clostridia bacterium]
MQAKKALIKINNKVKSFCVKALGCPCLCGRPNGSSSNVGRGTTRR